MKSLHIVLVFICFSIFSFCHTQKSSSVTVVNAETVDSRGNLVLLGKSTKERLQKEPFAQWFNKNYQEYHIDSVTATAIKSKLRNKKFVIFMGTWCGDSRLEVPRIYKLLDYCQVPNANITLINVSSSDSMYKQSPGHEEKGLNIHRVPDLLVYEKGLEIGRIVERPKLSWEKDLSVIVNREKYQPRYEVVSYLHNLFSDVPEDKIEKEMVKIADSLRSHISKNEGLQSYGNLLFATNERVKALIVYRLNTMLYPSTGTGFVALADAYMRMGEKMKARENYQQALVLEPSNEKSKTDAGTANELKSGL